MKQVYTIKWQLSVFFKCQEQSGLSLFSRVVLCDISPYLAGEVATAPTFLCVIQTRKTAGWLAGELSREGHQVALLSGEMQVEQRAAVIDRFRDGKEKVLVTTNVCARGKDHVLRTERFRIMSDDFFTLKKLFSMFNKDTD